MTREAKTVDLNKMRELKNVVTELVNNPQLAEMCYRLSNESMEMYIHNAGICAIYGETDSKEIQKAKTAMYLKDLIHAITCYIEDGNGSTFTIGNSRYPNAETFDWENGKESEE